MHGIYPYEWHVIALAGSRGRNSLYWVQSVDPNFPQHLLARQHAPAGEPYLRIISFYMKSHTSKALYKSRVLDMNLVARGFQQDDSGSDRVKSTP